MNAIVYDQIKRLAKLQYELDIQPAFMAFMSTDTVPVSSKTKIVFPDVRLNVDGYYNESTGFFKARVAGTYHFALTLSNIDSSYPAYSAAIVRNDGEIIQSVAYFGKDIIHMRTITALVRLFADATVWIRSGTSRMKLAPGKYSFSSGFLVHRL